MKRSSAESLEDADQNARLTNQPSQESLPMSTYQSEDSIHQPTGSSSFHVSHSQFHDPPTVDELSSLLSLDSKDSDPTTSLFRKASGSLNSFKGLLPLPIDATPVLHPELLKKSQSHYASLPKIDLYPRLNNDPTYSKRASQIGLDLDGQDSFKRRVQYINKRSSNPDTHFTTSIHISPRPIEPSPSQPTHRQHRIELKTLDTIKRQETDHKSMYSLSSKREASNNIISYAAGESVDEIDQTHFVSTTQESSQMPSSQYVNESQSSYSHSPVHDVRIPASFSQGLSIEQQSSPNHYESNLSFIPVNLYVPKSFEYLGGSDERLNESATTDERVGMKVRSEGETSNQSSLHSIKRVFDTHVHEASPVARLNSIDEIEASTEDLESSVQQDTSLDELRHPQIKLSNVFDIISMSIESNDASVQEIEEKGYNNLESTPIRNSAPESLYTVQTDVKVEFLPEPMSTRQSSAHVSKSSVKASKSASIEEQKPAIFVTEPSKHSSITKQGPLQPSLPVNISSELESETSKLQASFSNKLRSSSQLYIDRLTNTSQSMSIDDVEAQFLANQGILMYKPQFDSTSLTGIPKIMLSFQKQQMTIQEEDMSSSMSSNEGLSPIVDGAKEAIEVEVKKQKRKEQTTIRRTRVDAKQVYFEKIVGQRKILFYSDGDLVLFDSLLDWQSKNPDFDCEAACQHFEASILERPCTGLFLRVLYGTYDFPFILKYDKNDSFQNTRDLFVGELLKQGLYIEREVSVEDPSMVYIKLLAPFDTLCEAAERHKLRMRIKKMQAKEVAKTKETTIDKLAWFWRECGFDQNVSHIPFNRRYFDIFLPIEGASGKVWQLHDQFFDEREIILLVQS